MSFRDELELRQRLRDSEEVLHIVMLYARELEYELVGRRENPEQLVTNGLLGTILEGAGKSLKKRHSRKKAERAEARAAVAQYRVKKAREEAR